VPADAQPRALGGEPAPVVGYLGEGDLAFNPELYPHMPGLGVAADVGQGLLDDAREFLARLPGPLEEKPSSTTNSSS
jgi:hypothetical protein